jgi:hypothetical protein
MPEPPPELPELSPGSSTSPGIFRVFGPPDAERFDGVMDFPAFVVMEASPASVIAGDAIGPKITPGIGWSMPLS